MRKLFIIVAMLLVGFAFTSCNNKRSVEETEALIKAAYIHELDSTKLALAEARAQLAEEKASKKESHHSTSSATPIRSGAVYGTDFDWLSERYCTFDDIAGLSSWDLCILRNSMYARHGRKFKRADLRDFFGQYSWYHPRYSEVTLSALEQANVNFIKSYE